MRTSWWPAASPATSRASAGETSRKWKVAPPSISIGGCGRWVSTKVGVAKRGYRLSTHRPRSSRYRLAVAIRSAVASRRFSLFHGPTNCRLVGR